MSDTIRGTIAELAGRVTVNGQVADQPALSVLTRLGMAKEVAIDDKPSNRRGRASKVWEFPVDGNVVVARK